MPEARLMPQKTREVQTAICDSTRWKWFEYRDDDVIIATYAKTGTTWTQQIVGQLIMNGAEADLFMASPWLDFRAFPLEVVLGGLEQQKHRRFIKTHLPLDALIFSPRAKYLYIARDGRDVLWSMYNHHAGFTDEAYAMMNTILGRVGPPVEKPTADIVEYVHQWLDGAGGLPLGATFWEHVQGWWDARNLPNVLLVHYNNLKADLPGEMRRIAGFLDIPIDEARFPLMVEHCTFDYMRKNAAQHSPILNQAFVDGGNTFFNKGTNGRWRDVLSKADLEKYERMVKANLTPECARWLETGELP